MHWNKSPGAELQIGSYPKDIVIYKRDMHFALSESGKDRERKERIEKEKEHIQASATEDGPNRLQATEPVHNTPSRALVGSQPASPVKSPPPKGGHRRTRDARRRNKFLILSSGGL